MKKNMAIAMSAMMTAGAVVPAFADSTQDTIKEVTVNTRTARGQKLVALFDGSDLVERVELDAKENATEIKAEKERLEAAKKELEKYANEKYATVVNGEAVLKAKYEIKINESESRYKAYVNDRGAVDTAVVYDVINTQTKQVEAKYTFVGLQRLDLSNGNFGQGEATDQYEDITFDFATDVDYAELAKIKAELTANASKIKLEQKKDDNNDNDASTYNVTLTVKLTDGSKVTTITFKNVQKYDEAAMAKEDGLLAANTNGDIKSHWAKTEVLKAMTNGWVDATDTFRPEDQITRAEFVKVVNRAFNLNAIQPLNEMDLQFSDVDKSEWYYKEVKVAVERGLINGYEDGTFRPNAPITRQEAAKIIALVMNNGVSVETLKPVNETTSVHVDVETGFADDALIPAWVDESVLSLSKGEQPVIKGYEVKVGGATVREFRPGNNITRAEAVVMMQRATK